MTFVWFHTAHDHVNLGRGSTVTTPLPTGLTDRTTTICPYCTFCTCLGHTYDRCYTRRGHDPGHGRNSPTLPLGHPPASQVVTNYP